MHTSVHSDYLHCSRTTSLTSRTAVYGPVRTVVWQGSAGDCRPYADQGPLSFVELDRFGSWQLGMEPVCRKLCHAVNGRTRQINTLGRRG